MKTFKQFILEAEYYYSPKSTPKWGLIHPKGHLVHGDTHPTAKNHIALIKATNKTKENPSHYVHYSLGVEHDHALNIAGDSTHLQKKNIIKNWHKLPHSHTGNVHLDLSAKKREDHFGASGHKDKVLNQLKAHEPKE